MIGGDLVTDSGSVSLLDIRGYEEKPELAGHIFVDRLDLRVDAAADATFDIFEGGRLAAAVRDGGLKTVGVREMWAEKQEAGVTIESVMLRSGTLLHSSPSAGLELRTHYGLGIDAPVGTPRVVADPRFPRKYVCAQLDGMNRTLCEHPELAKLYCISVGKPTNDKKKKEPSRK